MKSGRNINKVLLHSKYREGGNLSSLHAKDNVFSPSYFKKILRIALEDAKDLKKLRFIQNEILSNTGYHEKAMEEQLKKLENVKSPNDDIETCKQLFDLRHKKAVELQNFMKDSFKDCDIEGK